MRFPARFTHAFSHWAHQSLHLGVCGLLGWGGTLLSPSPAVPAERILAIYGPLELSLPVSALETYASSGQITPELQPYTRLLTPATMAEARQLLQRRFTITPVALSRFLDAPMGKMLLSRASQIINPEPGQNSGQQLRTGLLAAAKDPQGLTLLSLMRNFPGESLRLNTELLLAAKQELTALSSYRDAALKAIAEAAQTEATSTPVVDFAQRPDLQRPGPFQVLRRTLDLSTNRNRQSVLGEKIGLRFDVDLYLPQGQTQPAPVVVISHGLGSGRRDFVYLAEHLASHGFAVAVPEHIGSNAQRLQSLLDGTLQRQDVSPVEFIDRPRDIQYLLDELQRLSGSDPTLRGRLNLQQVGVMGHSFGGYTTLALAGAELNRERLQSACTGEQLTLNISLLLQCRAESLPPFSYNLYDPRIKAAIAMTPLTSAILGPENMGQIRIPTMLISGSSDFVTPAIPEQIHPFFWLNTPDKYLAVLIPSGHNFSVAGAQSQGGQVPVPAPASAPRPVQPAASPFSELGQALAGPDPQLSQGYVKALSLAFMQTYIANRPEFRPYLSAAYARTLSREPVKLELVRSLTPDQLQKAYGNPLPVPIVPPLATDNVASNTLSDAPSVLQEIQKTGVLKASIREDSAPFAEKDISGKRIGYCVDLLNALTNRLQTQLNRPVSLDITTSSTLANRFELVQSRTVHLECGPNTITRTPLQGTTFSAPFFITGTHLLTRKTPKPTVNLQNNLQNSRVGVFSRTTTAAFVRRAYPAAQIVAFEGATARTTAFEALASGKIDAIANDGILLVTQMERQKLPLSQYTLVPERPLTCDAYGMILPTGDRQWETTVNQFIGSQPAKQIWDKWFKSLYPYILLNVDYCADR